MNFQISGQQPALASVHLITKYGAARLPYKYAGCEWLEAASDKYLSWSVTVSLTIALTSGVDVSTFEPQEDILNIYRDIN